MEEETIKVVTIKGSPMGNILEVAIEVGRQLIEKGGDASGNA
jgi:hypothetical protein